MNRRLRFTAVISLACLLSQVPPTLLAQTAEPLDADGIEQLEIDTGRVAQISLHPATGGARFVRLEGPQLQTLLPSAPEGLEPEALAGLFFDRYGSIFGVRNFDRELVSQRTDTLGATHLEYRQVYRGVPVFGAVLKVHVDSENNLRVVNGTFVPAVAVNPTPTWNATAASERALATVSEQVDSAAADNITVRASALYVFREGLARGVVGPNHLVWEVEVGNGAQIREFLYVSAHTGKVVDQITGIHEALNRRAFDTEANHPNNPFWVEGDSFPTGNTEADNVIAGTGETYGIFWNGFGYDSWDGAGGVMDGVFNLNNPQLPCPNAFWNGQYTAFCAGVTADDTVAHEWGHAYTDSTHNLIYQWQSGALNESYSDMFGEVVDETNGRGTDTPNNPRTAGACSTLGGSPPPRFEVNSPPGIAGIYDAGGAAFNPTPPALVTSDVELVNDGIGIGSPTDGCEPLVDFTSGNIALIDRGNCNFTVKVVNAQNANAVGVVVVNDQQLPNGVINMGGDDPSITIPSVMVGNADGQLIKDELPSPGVNATIELAVSTDVSIRWLSGEDDPASGGAIRDLWNPNCFGDPGKVTDTVQYICDESDSGGVHTNSGVPNHGFALLVDGGTYNGQTVTALGRTKATHLYWQAMSVYQVPFTDFADHADALEQSCSDLIGVDLLDLLTGNPSGEMISAADCTEVSDAIAAIELRTPPDFCNFQPLLDPNAPELCSASTPFVVDLFFDDLESDPTSSWTLTNFGVNPEYVPRDWEWVGSLPGGRAGMAFFGIDSIDIGDCVPGSDDQSGVMRATSPLIAITDVAPQLAFDHWVATEALFDGGNVKIRVNGGAWTIVPSTAFTFNAYNDILDPPPGNTNPLAGEEAFTGTDGGSISGSWGRSIVDVSSFAGPGDTVRLRLELGVDGCNGAVGWYADDIHVFTCSDVDPDLIFTDGFESGDVSAWSGTVP